MRLCRERQADEEMNMICSYAERPADKSAGYDHKASLRRLLYLSSPGGPAIGFIRRAAGLRVGGGLAIVEGYFLVGEGVEVVDEAVYVAIGVADGAFDEGFVVVALALLGDYLLAYNSV